jgi:hypothetical protein
MSATERSSNLLFLLGLASIAPAPGTSGADDGDDDGVDDDDGDSAPGEGGDGPAGTSGATTGPNATTFDPGGTTLPPEDTDYGYPDCTMPPPAGPIGPLCMSYGAKLQECYGAEIPPRCVNFYTAYCQYDVDGSAMDSPACGSAVQEMYACLSALDCATFGSETACEAQFMALDTACGAEAPPSRPRGRLRR